MLDIFYLELGNQFHFKVLNFSVRMNIYDFFVEYVELCRFLIQCSLPT